MKLPEERPPEVTDLAADGRTAGFPGGQAFIAGHRQPAGDGLNLGGFSAAFDAF